MKTITLMKDLDSPEGYFKAGETIEVADDVYEYLMMSYLEERKALVERIKFNDFKGD